MVFEIFGPELGGMILLGLWLYAILDVISTDEILVRNLSKGMWLLIVIFLPDVGSIAWLMVGRPHGAGWRPGDTSVRPVRRVRGPEDDDRWSPPTAPAPKQDETARLKAWEDDLKRREAALEKKPDDPDKGEGFTFRW
ncbi:MAG: hypothetical protein V7636_2179 [Actinomycetota bacterium]|jgi:hypothetical protein